MDKILVIDDEKAIVEMIEEFLNNSDFKIIKGYSKLDALALVDDTIDLILLDISLDNNPNEGFDVCKAIRKDYTTPIIFLSAKTTSLDKVTGFNAGGDDYITKPFDPMELIARIKANLRRYKTYDQQNPDIIHFKNLKMNTTSKRVFVNQQEISLSKVEYRLLKFLLENSNRILSREDIRNNVWNSEHYDVNVVNTTIMRLRKKLSKNKNEFIESVHGRGYIVKK